MSSTKKGNDWYFGMKAHIGADADGGVTHSPETSTAKVQDSQVWDALQHGEETPVWAGEGYVSTEREAAFKVPGDQAPVPPCDSTLPGVGQEPRAAVHAVRARQPVPRAKKADGMRTSLSEIDRTTGVAVTKLQNRAQNARVAAMFAVKLPARRSRTP